MSGNKVGGAKAVATIYERHGRNFFAEIGRKGGKNGHTGGFASDLMCDCGYDDGNTHHYRQCAGAKGGYISRKSKSNGRKEG